MTLVFREVTGDLFSVDADVSLAHCVSEDFQMSKGIAKLFRIKFACVNELKAQSENEKPSFSHFDFDLKTFRDEEGRLRVSQSEEPTRLLSGDERTILSQTDDATVTFEFRSDAKTLRRPANSTLGDATHRLRFG